MTDKIKLPPEGIFVGSGIYPTETDTLLCTMRGHYGWQCQYFSVIEHLDRVVEENQGNLVQLWGIPRGFTPRLIGEWIYDLADVGVDIPDPDWDTLTHLSVDEPEYKELFAKYESRMGAGFYRFLMEAKKRGLYTTLIYTDAKHEWIRRMVDEGGQYYLGYDFGEKFSDSLNGTERLLALCPDGVPHLAIFADHLRDAVQSFAAQRHRDGWKFVMATSSEFHIDYEVAGGADMPVIEDFAFASLNLASAISRGLYRQHELPLWGSHLAHEHYDWQPDSAPHRYDTLRAAFYLKYMAGSKMIINESGNWFVEHTLSPDSPRLQMPQEASETLGVIGWGDARRIVTNEPEKMVPYIHQARPYYGMVDARSPVCQSYRRVISDFWNFVKANGTPEGQPETTVALAKGNLDLTSARYNHGYAICGLYDVALQNGNWFQGAPERGWKLARDVFFPEVPVTAPYVNIHLSGTPYGQVDVVSFAYDEITPEFLLSHYKALLFTGWNTSSETQYRILCDYVAGGGTLFISIPQLSTDDTRNFAYTTDTLVHGGDFSELCGVRVLARGENIYWSMIPRSSHALGEAYPRRFGILGVPLGQLEITDPAIEVCITDDETDRPVLLCHRYGKGKCYFLNTWTYPGACDLDEGPGATMHSGGMIGTIFRAIAHESRGHVYITDDGTSPGDVCRYVSFSYFPDGGKICLFNIDFEAEKTFWLHQFGVREKITLAPGEFRMLDTVRA